MLLASGLVIGLLPGVNAADRSAAAAVSRRPSDLRIRDWQLTIYARQALTHDQVLAPLNLGVSVRKGVATLWGPVTSAATALRALDCVRRLPGLDDVRSELYIVDDNNPSLPSPAGPAVPPPATPPRPPARLVERSGTVTAAPGQTLSVPRVTLPVDPRRPADEQPTRVQPPRASFTGSISFEPAVNAAQPSAISPPAAVLLPPRPLDSNTRLYAAVERLRQSDARFRHLQSSVRGGIVTLTGATPSGEDLMEFAQAVGRLPGVERVVLGDIRTAPNLWQDRDLRGLRIEEGR